MPPCQEPLDPWNSEARLRSTPRTKPGVFRVCHKCVSPHEDPLETSIQPLLILVQEMPGKGHCEHRPDISTITISRRKKDTEKGKLKAGNRNRKMKTGVEAKAERDGR